MKKIINLIDEKVKRFRESNPSVGLPQDLFHLTSRLTPIVNVDLLIKDEHSRVLLAWRSDEFSGEGWHIPGGIVRYKEKLKDRVVKVAELEINHPISFKDEPMCVNEIFRTHNTRGHFISFLYNCVISEEYTPRNYGLANNDPGFLKWHDTCPQNLVDVHEIYRDHIERVARNER